MRDFRTTIRDELIADCPPSQDIDLPTDGSKRRIVVYLLAVLIVVYLGAYALIVGAV